MQQLDYEKFCCALLCHLWCRTNVTFSAFLSHWSLKISSISVNLTCSSICALIKTWVSLQGFYIHLCTFMHTGKASGLLQAGHITWISLGPNRKKYSDVTMPARPTRRATDRSIGDLVHSKPLLLPWQRQNKPSTLDGRSSSRFSCHHCSTARIALELKDKKIAELSSLSLEQRRRCQEKNQSWIKLSTVIRTQFAHFKLSKLKILPAQPR